MNPFDIAPILKRILANSPGTSEVVFAPENYPKVINGQSVSNAPLKDLKRFSAYQTEMLAATLLAGNKRAQAQFVRDGSANLSLTVPKTNHFRVQLLRQVDGISVALRVVPFHPPTLESLALPRSVAPFMEQRKGLILVTSPSRGGKTTTLAAILHHLNQSIARHIITVEAPVEYRLPPGKGLVQYLEIDKTESAYLTGFQQALRQGSQVVMCAHLDHPELLQLAVDAASAGHLIIGGMRTSSAFSTIERMRTYFPEGQSRARFCRYMSCIISQDLIPRKDGGRVATYEILHGNDTVSQIIERGGGANEIKEILRKYSSEGMQSFAHDLNRLVKMGLVPEREAMNLQPRATGEFKAMKIPKDDSPKRERGNRMLELDDSMALEVME